MGRLLHEQGELDSALELLCEAADLSGASLPDGHRERLRSHGWLAELHCSRGRAIEARTVLDGAVLAAARASFGATAETTLMLEAIDARLQVLEGRGVEPLHAALARMRSSLGPLNPEVRWCERSLAQAVRSQP